MAFLFGCLAGAWNTSWCTQGLKHTKHMFHKGARTPASRQYVPDTRTKAQVTKKRGGKQVTSQNWITQDTSEKMGQALTMTRGSRIRTCEEFQLSTKESTHTPASQLNWQTAEHYTVNLRVYGFHTLRFNQFPLEISEKTSEQSHPDSSTVMVPRTIQ